MPSARLASRALTWRDTRSATMIAFALVPAASTWAQWPLSSGMQGLAELSYDCEAVDSGISVPLDDQLPGRKSMGLREDAMREAERAQAHQANHWAKKSA